MAAIQWATMGLGYLLVLIEFLGPLSTLLIVYCAGLGAYSCARWLGDGLEVPWKTAPFHGLLGLACWTWMAQDGIVIVPLAKRLMEGALVLPVAAMALALMARAGVLFWSRRKEVP